jgi:hypothetical protein
LIHRQNNGGLAGRMFARRLYDEKIGTRVGDAEGFAVDDQPHLHQGRMCAVMLFRHHNEIHAVGLMTARGWPPPRRFDAWCPVRNYSVHSMWAAIKAV